MIRQTFPAVQQQSDTLILFRKSVIKEEAKIQEIDETFSRTNLLTHLNDKLDFQKSPKKTLRLSDLVISEGLRIV